MNSLRGRLPLPDSLQGWLPRVRGKGSRLHICFYFVRKVIFQVIIYYYRQSLISTQSQSQSQSLEIELVYVEMCLLNGRRRALAIAKKY